MKNFIYNLGIRLYVCLIFLAAPFNAKARAWIRGRKSQISQIKHDFKDNNDKIAWFHCASLGEFEQGRPVLEMFKKKFGEYKILLTFFSPSGYQIRKDYPLADWVYYLPEDTYKQAKLFCDTINPALVFFVKYEFWYNYLTILAGKGVPVFSVSTILRPGQWLLHKHNPWGKASLQSFAHFFVQQAQTKQLLCEAHIPQTRISISGDTRYDRVWAIANGGAVNIPSIQIFVAEKPVCVAGSVWQADMNLIIPAYLQVENRLKIIIAPHQIDPNQIAEWATQLKTDCLFYSKIETYQTKQLQEANVLFIDVIGLLSSVYQYGNMAWIGGGFGAGIHNTLEAAAFGLPIGFGPKYKKFEEANALIALGAVRCATNQEEVNQWFLVNLEDAKASREAGSRAAELVNQNQHATQIIMTELEKNWIK